MKKLYLVRHGQTLFNLMKKTQGWCDSPLTDLGIQQALSVKQYFEEQGIYFDKVYSSTSERCCDTTELITDQPYTRTKGLKEWNFGIMEGESESLRIKRPEGQLTHGDFFVQWGGESDVQLIQRYQKTLDDITQSEGETLLCVTHAGAMWTFFLQRNHPEDLQGEPFGNCCILEYEVEGDDYRFIRILNPASKLID